MTAFATWWSRSVRNPDCQVSNRDPYPGRPEWIRRRNRPSWRTPPPSTSTSTDSKNGVEALEGTLPRYVVPFAHRYPIVELILPRLLPRCDALFERPAGRL